MDIIELLTPAYEAAWLPWAVQYFFLIGLSYGAFLLSLPGIVGRRPGWTGISRLALLGVKRRRVYGLVLGVQALVGAQARPELGDARQRGVVGGAQLGRVHDAVEVVHRTPGAPQVFGGDVQHAGDGAPVGRKVGLGDLLQGGIGTCQQLIDGGRDLLGGDAVKQRQIGKIKQGRCVHGRSEEGRGPRFKKYRGKCFFFKSCLRLMGVA